MNRKNRIAYDEMQKIISLKTYVTLLQNYVN